MSNIPRPSLALIPSARAEGKLYSVLPQGGSGDFDVLRNSTGTRFNRSGQLESVPANVPRFDFDPLTGEFRGVLVEPNTTNFVVSGNPNNLGSSGYDFEETQDDIFGTAYKVFEPLGYSGAHRFFEQLVGSVWANNTRVRYVIAKSGSGGRFLQVSPRQNGWNGVLFNLEEQSFQIRANTFYTPFVIKLKNGWAIYGFIDKVPDPLGSNLMYSISITPLQAVDSNSTNYENDGSYIYVLPYPMAYIGEGYIMPIPTSGSQVTRVAEIAQNTNLPLSFTKNNFSLYFEFDVLNQPVVRGMVSLRATFNNYAIRTRLTTANALSLLYLNNAAGQTAAETLIAGAPTVIGKNKVALILNRSANTVRCFLNGVNVPTTNLNFPIPSAQSILSLKFTTSDTGAPIAKNYLWNIALTDQQAIQLTTL